MAALHLDKDREKSQQEYEIIRDAFVRLLDRWDNSAESMEILTDIIIHRSAFLVERAITGLSLDFEEALALLRNHNDFTTDTQRKQRDILLAAIDNLVDFAAAERVRPWHEALEGVSYPKREFPSELIPPIEYACRCYLVADGFGSVVGALPESKPSFAVHPVFRESLCTGGRIFSGEHPYFQRPLPPQIQKIVRNIKQKFYLP
ncbi:hypothetical protein [Alistipes indistinctus]|uniref:hypothetical protein n=1 Tax=Alistipes indistinctus TaxID=626932 RepID=UPI003AF04C69